MSVIEAVGVSVAQLVLGFYGFWLVWRVLLCWLPGPVDSDERIAPFARWFTAPFVDRGARWLHLPDGLVAAVALVVVAAAMAALGALG